MMLSLDPFQLAVNRVGGGAANALHATLLAAWAEPARHYHTQQHLEECLELAEQWGTQLTPLDYTQLVLALWFHDAVYNPRSALNELKSAEMARQELSRLGVSPTVQERIAQLVMATAHGTPTPPGDAVIDLLLDIDLAILGAPAARFAEYEAQVREEYSWVDATAYADGRGKVLAHFRSLAYSEPPMLYRTPAGHTLLAQARINLAE